MEMSAIWSGNNLGFLVLSLVRVIMEWVEVLWQSDGGSAGMKGSAADPVIGKGVWAAVERGIGGLGGIVQGLEVFGLVEGGVDGPGEGGLEGRAGGLEEGASLVGLERRAGGLGASLVGLEGRGSSPVEGAGRVGERIGSQERKSTPEGEFG